MGRPLFQRRGGIDQQLEDLIKAGSWKQAIALSEKRIKKGDKSDGALVCAADSLYSHLHCVGSRLENSILLNRFHGRSQRLMSFWLVLIRSANS